ncbi:MAG: hypothetical protein L3K07_03755 [Thermoplasmata archaeon]|nr:hypothetical protein [Thermoplasmata archaeon]
MVPASADEANEIASTRRALRSALLGVLGLLGLQYLLGSWVNLFGSFPTGPASLGNALVDVNDAPLVAHILLAVALLFLGLVALAYSWSLPPRRLRLQTTGGFLSLLLASVGGLGFVYSSYSSASFSYLMAGAFLVAAALYGAALSIVGGPRSEESRGQEVDRLPEAR